MDPSSAPHTVTITSGESSTQQIASPPLTLKRVRFESAHSPMYRSAERPNRFGKDWGYRTDPRTSRSWRSGESAPDPVSHTGNERITLSVSLKFTPVEEVPLEGMLCGEPEHCEDHAFQFWSDNFKLQPERNEIQVQGTARLGPWPGRRTRTVRWTFYPKDADEIELGTSGPHTVFVTFGPPKGEGQPEDRASVQRMQEATRRVRGIGPCNYPKLLHKLFKAFPGYVLSREHLTAEENAEIDQNPQLADYMKKVDWPSFVHSEKRTGSEIKKALMRQGGAWPLADLERFRGECQAILRFVRGVAMQVGLPGTIEVKFVTGDFNQLGRAIISDHPQAIPGDDASKQYALVDAPVQEGELYSCNDSRVGFNNYEAYLRYRYTRNGQNRQSWYGGGIARNVEEPQNDVPSDEVQKCLLGAFKGIAEVEWTQQEGKEMPRVVRYRPFPWVSQGGDAGSSEN